MREQLPSMCGLATLARGCCLTGRRDSPEAVTGAATTSVLLPLDDSKVCWTRTYPSVRTLLRSGCRRRRRRAGGGNDPQGLEEVTVAVRSKGLTWAGVQGCFTG